ncbi:uncharacterized protein [Cherax quadricarinatus]
METSPKNKSGEATGVSRSGRVRKKSSKLADFESPDEIDTRFKRKTDRPIKSQKSTKIGQPMGADVYDDSDSYIEDEMIEVKDEPIEVEDWADNDDGDDDMCDDGDDKDDAPDLLHVDDDSTDMPRETTNYSLAQSLYFSEKQGKKNIMLKDGQVVRRKKAQRKDKGKSRFTAYMLWAREIRPGIICANPNMDFSAVNKRLGELWALVPTTQKYNWKRRAKRLAAKGNQKGSMITTGKAAKQSQNAVRSNLINKGGVKPQQVIRTPSKQSEAGQTAPPQTHKAHTTTPKNVAKTKRQEAIEAAATVAKKKRQGTTDAAATVAKTKRQGSTDAATTVAKVKRQGTTDAAATVTKAKRQGRTDAAATVAKKKRKGATDAPAAVAKKKRQGVTDAAATVVIKKHEEEETVTNIGVIFETANQWEDTLEAELSADSTPVTIIIHENGDVPEITKAVVVGDAAGKYVSQAEPKQCPQTIGEIFREIKTKNSDSCLDILEVAIEKLLSNSMSWDQVSEFYCISKNRLERNMKILTNLKSMPDNINYFQTYLKFITCISDSDKFFEWMLRMRKMGRLPVIKDICYVKEYLSLSSFPTGICDFLEVFGEKLVHSEDWGMITNSSVRNWETMLKKHLTNYYGITAETFLVKNNASRVFNCVEMFLSHTHIRNEVIILRGRRNTYSFVGQNQKGISVMVTFSAAGFCLKPLFLQNGFDRPLWSDQDFLEQSQFHVGASGNGQLDPLLFLTWLKLFNAELIENEIEKPVLLFLHGHPCHASLEATTFCQEEGIILFSHYHSPLNILDPFLKILGKFHYQYDRSLKIFEISLGKDLSQKYFPLIFLDAWNKIQEAEFSVDAFEKCGLVPFDMSVVYDNINTSNVQSQRSTLLPTH